MGYPPFPRSTGVACLVPRDAFPTWDSLGVLFPPRDDQPMLSTSAPKEKKARRLFSVPSMSFPLSPSFRQALRLSWATHTTRAFSLQVLPGLSLRCCIEFFCLDRSARPSRQQRGGCFFLTMDGTSYFFLFSEHSEGWACPSLKAATGRFFLPKEC